MKATQYSMRALWTEHVKFGEKPTPRQMTTPVRLFWGRDVDPVDGMDPAAVVATARTFARSIAGQIGETGWGVNVMADSRVVTRHGDIIEHTTEWESLAVITLDDAGAPVVTYPQQASARNVEKVREAAAQLARYPDTQRRPVHPPTDDGDDAA